MSETLGPFVLPGATTWRVLLDVEMGGDTVHPELPDVREDRDHCRHCGPVYYKECRRSSPPQTTYHTVHWVLPRAVEIDTDGGESGTVCLDCILELAPQVPARGVAGDGLAAAHQANLRPGVWARHDGSWGYVASMYDGGYYVTLSMWRGLKTKVVRAGEVEEVSVERPGLAERLEGRLAAARAGAAPS